MNCHISLVFPVSLPVIPKSASVPKPDSATQQSLCPHRIFRFEKGLQEESQLLPNPAKPMHHQVPPAQTLPTPPGLGTLPLPWAALTTFSMKDFPPISNVNLPWSNLRLLALVP